MHTRCAAVPCVPPLSSGRTPLSGTRRRPLTMTDAPSRLLRFLCWLFPATLEDYAMDHHSRGYERGHEDGCDWQRFADSADLATWGYPGLADRLADVPLEDNLPSDLGQLH